MRTKALPFVALALLIFAWMAVQTVRAGGG
jgi:hypothetical protein